MAFTATNGSIEMVLDSAGTNTAIFSHALILTPNCNNLQQLDSIPLGGYPTSDTISLALTAGTDYFICFGRDLSVDCPSGHCPPSENINICLKEIRQEEEGISWSSGGNGAICDDYLGETDTLDCTIQICTDQSISIFPTQGGNILSIPVNWSFPNANNQPTNPASGPVTVSYSNPGTYLCYWSDPTTFDPVYFIIEVIGSPPSNLTYTTSATTICLGGSVDVLNLNSNGSNVTYDLSVIQDPNIGVNGNTVGPFQDTGTYTVNVVASNACGVIGSSFQVDVEEISLEFDYTPNCDSVVFSNESACTDSYQNVQAQWFFGDGTNSFFINDTVDVTHVYASPGTYIVTMNLSYNLNGLTFSLGSHQDTVVVGGEPTLNFATSIDCGELTITNLTECRTFITDWLWNFGDGTTSTQENPPPHLYSQNGTYPVKLFITLSDGSTYSLIQQVTVGTAPPPVEIEGATSLCCDQLDFYVQDQYATYDWSINTTSTNCPGCTIVNDGTDMVSVIPDSPSTDALFICVEATDTNGCVVEDCDTLLRDCCSQIYVDPEQGVTLGFIDTTDMLLVTSHCASDTLSQLIDVNGNVLSGTYNASSDYIILNHDLIVDVDAFWANANVRIKEGHEIKVEAGVTFKIDQSALQAQCNQEMWKGINLSAGTSEFLSDNSLIKHAEAAVTSTGGANYTIEDTEFKNNWIGILVRPHNALHPGTVVSSIFETDSQLFPPYSAEPRAFAGIKAEGVDSLIIGDVGNVNTNTFNALKFGIHGTATSMLIQNNTFNDIVDPSGNPNNFEYKGIYASNTIPDVNVQVGGNNAQSNEFNNVNIAFHTQGRVNTLSSRNQINQIENYGIWLEFNNDQNNIHFVSRNEIYTDQGEVAIFARDNYGTNITIKDNAINNYNNRLYTGVYVSQTAIPPTTGDVRITGNRLRQCELGIVAMNIPEVYIGELNRVQISAPNSFFLNNPGVVVSGILMFNCLEGEIDNNQVTRSGDTPNNQTEDQFLTGVFVQNSAFSYVHNNNVVRFGRGIWADQSNPNSRFYCNTLNHNWHGFYFGNGQTGADIGNQGISAGVLPFRPFGVTSDNYWIFNQGPNKMDGELIQLTEWYHKPGFFYNPNPISADLDPALNTIQLGYAAARGCGPFGGPNGPIGGPFLRQLFFADIVQSLNVFNSDTAAFRYWEQTSAFKVMDADTAVLYLDPATDQDYQTFYNNHKYGSCGQLNTAEKAFAQKDASGVNNHCSQTTPSCIRQQNAIDVYQLCAQKYLVDSVYLSASDTLWLQNLACADPLIEGPAVYSARTLLGKPVLCFNNGQLKSSMAANDSDGSGIAFLLYPNPGNDVVRVESSAKINRINVYDISGKRVKTIPANGSKNHLLDISYISSGVYLVEVIGDTYQKTEKLIIE